MESKNPKMIRIKLPKQRIMSLNSCNQTQTPGKPAPVVTVQKTPIIVSNNNVKQKKTIVRREDVDNNTCYFEVFDHTIGKENSTGDSPTERVYVTPQIPIKKEPIEEPLEKSFLSKHVQKVRVYTDSNKKGPKTSAHEIRKKYEEIMRQRIMKQSVAKKENKHNLRTSCEIAYAKNVDKIEHNIVIQNVHSKNENDTQNEHLTYEYQPEYEQEKENETQEETQYVEETQYEYETLVQDDQEPQYEQEVEYEYDTQNEHESHECKTQNEIQMEQNINIEYVLPDVSEQEVQGECEVKLEPEDSKNDITNQDYEETMDTFFISNKIQDKVAIVKTEETENLELDHELADSIEYQTGEGVQISDQNLFQIVTENGTLLLHNNEVIQDLIKKGQLIINDEDQDQEEAQEVVLCDGETLMDGKEYVLEYVDEAKDSPVETIACNICNAVFMNLQDFESHHDSHKDQDRKYSKILPPPQTYLCYCGQKFKNLDIFEEHQNKHKINFNIPLTSSDKYKCELCSKIFITASLLENHMISHQAKANAKAKKSVYRKEVRLEVPVICEICAKPFRYKSCLRIHRKRHIEGKKYECEHCKKRFSQRISLRKHRFTHINPVTCSHCDLIFRDKEVFELHKVDGICPMETAKEVIQRWKQEAITLDDVIGYICTVCNTFYNDEDELEQHIMTTHILDSSTLFCFECGEKASSKEDLQKHIMTHVQVYNKRITCKVCGVICESKATLVVHQRVHTNERPFPCPNCPLSFKTKIHMQSHQLTHTKEKKFPCPICSKCFALKGNLQAHLRGHTGEKPYVCPLCKDTFKDTKILKKHKTLSHPDSDMPWGQYLKVSKTRPSNLALTRAHDY